MEENYKLYVHISPINKRYYGITSININKRWKNGKGYKNNEDFWNDINLYGWDNFKHEILFEGLTEDEARLMEKFYIELYDTTNGEKGYNANNGGGSIIGTGEKRVYCIENNTYYDSVTKASDELNLSMCNISECLNGKRKTCGNFHFVFADINNFEEQVELVMSEEYNKHKKRQGKRIYCIENNTYYDSIELASKELNCNQSCISMVLIGKSKTAKGLHFLYDEDVTEEKINEVMSYKSCGSKRKVMNVETKQIYSSLTECGRDIGVSRSSIYSAIKRGGKCKGYHFTYID